MPIFWGEEEKVDIGTSKITRKSFEMGNKLQFETKAQLAKSLGLPPRQIAVWFQNRRARCKTKQLERDFDILHQEYRVLKNKYGILLEQNEQLKVEVQRMNRKVEKIHDNNKARAFIIESDQKTANSVLKLCNFPIELSVKMEIPVKCSDPWRHIYPVTSKEGGHCSITSEAESSLFNIRSTRTVENPPSPISPITAANHSSAIHSEGYSVGEQAADGGLKMNPPGHVWQYLPEVEEDQSGVIRPEDSCCNLFCSLEEQDTLMPWE